MILYPFQCRIMNKVDTYQRGLQVSQSQIDFIEGNYLPDGVKERVGGVGEGAGQGAQELQGVLQRDYVVQTKLTTLLRVLFRA